MLAPQTFIVATLVTIAEPDDGPTYRRGYFLECAVCGTCFDDGSPAYVVGTFPPAYIHVACI